MDPSHLSRAAFERLQAELEERSTTRRRSISDHIERAREHGDISENAEYDYAKNEQGLNEARIRQLDQMLRTAVVVEDATGDVVEPGVLVDLLMEGDDAPTTFLVGSIEERSDDHDIVTTTSPLGQAILGATPGTTVTYEGPKRELRVTVVEIRPLG
ncbi:MAG TPA: transcription elongation factor GreA [Acidimicrobiia bacterium]|nr:transcription elongation factor GreA [Acidimicrobiia bacterium]